MGSGLDYGISLRALIIGGHLSSFHFTMTVCCTWWGIYTSSTHSRDFNTIYSRCELVLVLWKETTGSQGLSIMKTLAGSCWLLLLLLKVKMHAVMLHCQGPSNLPVIWWVNSVWAAAQFSAQHFDQTPLTGNTCGRPLEIRLVKRAEEAATLPA